MRSHRRLFILVTTASTCLVGSGPGFAQGNSSGYTPGQPFKFRNYGTSNFSGGSTSTPSTSMPTATPTSTTPSFTAPTSVNPAAPAAAPTLSMPAITPPTVSSPALMPTQLTPGPAVPNLTPPSTPSLAPSTMPSPVASPVTSPVANPVQSPVANPIQPVISPSPSPTPAPSPGGTQPGDLQPAPTTPQKSSFKTKLKKLQDMANRGGQNGNGANNSGASSDPNQSNDAASNSASGAGQSSAAANGGNQAPDGTQVASSSPAGAGADNGAGGKKRNLGSFVRAVGSGLMSIPSGAGNSMSGIMGGGGGMLGGGGNSAALNAISNMGGGGGGMSGPGNAGDFSGLGLGAPNEVPGVPKGVRTNELAGEMASAKQLEQSGDYYQAAHNWSYSVDLATGGLGWKDRQLFNKKGLVGGVMPVAEVYKHALWNTTMMYKKHLQTGTTFGLNPDMFQEPSVLGFEFSKGSMSLQFADDQNPLWFYIGAINWVGNYPNQVGYSTAYYELGCGLTCDKVPPNLKKKMEALREHIRLAALIENADLDRAKYENMKTQIHEIEHPTITIFRDQQTHEVLHSFNSGAPYAPYYGLMCDLMHGYPAYMLKYEKLVEYAKAHPSRREPVPPDDGTTPDFAKFVIPKMEEKAFGPVEYKFHTFI